MLKNLKPCKCESHLLCSPIAPCELFLRGVPGSIEINGIEYAVSILGYLPEQGEPVVDGFRLTKDNGEAHDVCLVAGRMECTCGDWVWRRALATSADVADCKHCACIKRHFASPVDQVAA